MSVLDVVDLVAGHGRIRVLDGVSLKLSGGDTVGILGPNGVGKTTLLDTLMGIVPATAGTVRLYEQDITFESPHRRARRGIGYVPQGRDIFPGLSVADNLRMGCAARDVDEKSAIAAVLEDFPRLVDLLDRPGSALSGGEQQLLAIARCLCAGPSLVLLDEPTEGVQPSLIDDIATALLRLRARHGLTMLLVEQNLEFIASLSSQVLVMQRGRISGEISPDALSDPRTVAEFIGLSA